MTLRCALDISDSGSRKTCQICSVTFSATLFELSSFDPAERLLTARPSSGENSFAQPAGARLIGDKDIVLALRVRLGSSWFDRDSARPGSQGTHNPQTNVHGMSSMAVHWTLVHLMGDFSLTVDELWLCRPDVRQSVELTEIPVFRFVDD